ncbi:MAG: hypothetical protein GY772_25455 [bacterium]|nr:hypothetical protein [bacterium]
MVEFATCIAKRFRHDRGYCFLERQDGCDLFLHKSVLDAAGLEPPLTGAEMEVEFELQERGCAVTRVISMKGGVADKPAVAADGVLPGRIKFFDWQRHFGFVNIFGRVGVDVHLTSEALQGFDLPPVAGEAVAVFLEEGCDRRAVRVIPWSMVNDGGEGDAA